VVARDDARADDFVAKAVALFEKECTPPEAECDFYAEMYAAGKATPADKEKATAIHERGCKLGSRFDCSELARLVGASPGEKSQLAFALDRACQLFQGADRCRAVGDMFRAGDGVPADEKRAQESYARAARMFDVECEHKLSGDACVGLGVLYRDGLGVTKDSAKAEQLLQRGCELTPSADECQPK